MATQEPTLKQALYEILHGLQSERNLRETREGLVRLREAFPGVAESVARGAVASVPGSVGDISEFARSVAPETMESTFGRRIAPTTREILDYVPRMTPTHEGASTLEEVGAAIAPGVGGVAKDLLKATKGMPIGNMIAYHGTPHEIKGKFDISKVGTGEGAQAYGHGMYFAENPAVAKEYQKLDPAGGASLYTRRTLKGEELTPQTPEYHAAHMVDKLGVKKARAEFEDWLKNPPSYADDSLKASWQKSLDTLKNVTKKSDFGTLKHEGNLYQVDIPDEHIPYMLDWDKPLSEQSEHIKNTLSNVFNSEEANIAKKIEKDALENYLKNASETLYPKDRFQTALKEAIESGDYGDTFNTNVWDELSEAAPDLDWKHIKNQLSASGTESITGKTIYQEAVKKYGSLQKASEELNKLGIKGVSYLDRGSRETGGTSNFVVFDPSDVKILEKNGQKVINTEYRGSHQAPRNDDYHSPAHELDRGMYPSDVYGPMGHHYYGEGDRVNDRAVLKILNEARGNPDHPITVYRAVPAEFKDQDINPGDWVTPTLDYAHKHGLRWDSHHIIEKTVPAKHLWSEGNSLHEFGYDPTE